MTQSDNLQVIAAESIVGLRSRVFAHVGNADQAVTLASFADGLVLRGAAGARSARGLEGAPLVALDRERYLEDRGKPRPAELFPETAPEAVSSQLAAGASVLLAPSRFPIDRSDDSIRTMLDIGAEFLAEAASLAPTVPAFVPVVIRYDELGDRRWVKPIKESGLPVATIFAGYGDPLATPTQLAGALEVIDAAESAFILRGDMSVAGLMAVGAVSGAIGTSSAVRHLWLPRKGANSPSPSIFVPHLANWMKLRFVEQALADPDLDELFACRCAVCGPDGDVRRLTLPEVGADLQDAHSSASAIALAHDVLRSEDPVSMWRDTCTRASSGYTLLDQLGISGPTEPGAVSSWLEVLR